MKRDIIIWIIGFLLAASFITFVAWCAGYNFDYRHPHVGVGVLMGGFFSSVIAFAFTTVMNQYYE